jgi:hypothetical protein
MTYSFTVEVSGIDPTSNYEDALYRVGCGDALIAVVDGKLFLDFDRDSSSYETAVSLAVRGLQEIGGRVVRVTPIMGELASGVFTDESPVPSEVKLIMIANSRALENLTTKSAH